MDITVEFDLVMRLDAVVTVDAGKGNQRNCSKANTVVIMLDLYKHKLCLTVPYRPAHQIDILFGRSGYQQA